MNIESAKARIAKRAATDLKDGMYVNLGVGIPTLVASFIPPDKDVVLHSENGMLGVGPPPAPGVENKDLINAGTQFVTVRRGGAFFSHVDSFVMVRGGHLDVALLGAFQVSSLGDLANWKTDDTSDPPAVGGAMDLAIGAKAVWVLMQHCAKDGRPKIVSKCTYPLTAANVVRRIYTDLAVINVTTIGLFVIEKFDGISDKELQACTAAHLNFDDSVAQ